MKGRKPIIKSILICMIILLILNLFNLKKYNEFVYYILSILTILSGSLILADNNIFGYKYFHVIGEILTLLIPLVWMAYTNTRYSDKIKNIESYNTLTNITNILLFTQVLLFGFNYFKNRTWIFLMIQIILSIINTFIVGIIWKESVYFVTDG